MVKKHGKKEHHHGADASGHHHKNHHNDDDGKDVEAGEHHSKNKTDATSFSEHRGKPHPNLEGVLSRDDSFDELLKQAQNERPKSPQQPPMSPLSPMSPKKKMGRVMDYDYAVQYDNENLGEDFESTPWMPPSVDKAAEFKRLSIYHGGTARIDAVNLTKVDDLGAGVILYFQFAMTMSITLGIMSFLSLPLILFTFYGSGVPEEERDGLGMYRYALGNIGHQDRDDAKCTADRYGEDTLCIGFWGREMSIEDAAGVITAMEVVSIVVFFIGVFHLHRRSFSVTGRAQKTQVSISDYAVEVHGIPPDCSDRAIMKHFSDLYALDKADWRGRPPVEGAEPVVDFVNTGDPMHVDTWVAECALHKSIGHFIASFKKKQYLMEKLFRCRARMKMYAENSPHTGGHREARYLKAEKDMLATGAKIDKLTEKTMKKRGLKVFLPNHDETLSPGSEGQGGGLKRAMSNISQISNTSSVYRNIDAPAVSVFIVFQYQESKVRCLDDYEKYSSIRYRLTYPSELMFRGHKLTVTPAVEPDRILWENLEVSWWEKMYLRVRTGVIVAMLVIACFIILLVIGIQKTEFSNSIPSRSLCSDTVPELFLNETRYDISLSTMELKRPDEGDRKDLDDACSDIIKDTFYVEYFTTKNIRDDEEDDDGNSTRIRHHRQLSDLVTDYSFDACEVEGDGDDEKGLCPDINRSVQCPCASTKSSVSCPTKTCFLDPDNADDDGDDDVFDTGKCRDDDDSFEARAIGACFCYAQLTEILRSRGPVETQDRIEQQREDGACTAFFQEYSRVSGLTVLSIIVTASVNVALRGVLVMLAKQERHSTTDEEHGSIISKIFFTNYVTMGILVLLAYGKWNGAPGWLKSTGILNGPYPDFNPDWYGNIGYYLLSTFILQSFGPLAMNLLKYYLLNPFLRFWHHRRVRELKSTTIVMQNDLNKMEVGPIFDPTLQTAQLLTLLFFAMTYAPGLPLLMPLCCFTFIMYFRIDKVLLCRFYQKPPQVGNAGMKLVIQYLPYAALLRMAFSIWMFGNYGVLPNDKNGDTSYSKFLESSRGSNRNIGVNSVIFRENVFPIFILFLFVAFCKFIIRIWKFLPIYWILKCFKIIFDIFSDKKDILSTVNSYGSIHPWEVIKLNDPRRQHVAPFTGDFFRYLKNKDEIPDTCLKMFNYHYLTNLTEIEVEEGWEIREEGDFVLKVKAWKNPRRGSGRRIGDLKKTYEVIGDKRVCTYNVEHVPAYVIPMQGLKEGVSSMIDYQSKHRADRNVVDSMLYDAFDAGANNTANMESNVVANYKKQKERRKSLSMGIDPDLDAEVMVALRDGEVNMRKQKQEHEDHMNEINEEDGYDEEDEQPSHHHKKKPGHHHHHHGGHKKHKPHAVAPSYAEEAVQPPPALESADSFFSPEGLVPEGENGGDYQYDDAPGQLAAEDSWTGGVGGLV